MVHRAGNSKTMSNTGMAWRQLNGKYSIVATKYITVVVRSFIFVLWRTLK